MKYKSKIGGKNKTKHNKKQKQKTQQWQLWTKHDKQRQCDMTETRMRGGRRPKYKQIDEPTRRTWAGNERLEEADWLTRGTQQETKIEAGENTSTREEENSDNDQTKIESKQKSNTSGLFLLL